MARQQGARDTTQKFLWRLADGALIESVLIPASPDLYGETERPPHPVRFHPSRLRLRLQILRQRPGRLETQPGAEEIVNQVLAVERSRRAGRGARWINNLVIMGMGEPLANYDNLLKALRILNAPWGGQIGARKITVSTSGLAPQIRRLADEPQQFRLAISLHGATDETRARIMPVNKKYPLNELAAACAYYQEKKGRMITLEYILIAGVNDGLDQVQPLAALARALRAKVNLIPYNKVEGLPWARPEEPAQEAFLAALEREKVPATLRREKGGDIDAACGQLRLKTEREAATHAVGP